VVLSCHEKEIFPLRDLGARYWDIVHFVSAGQRDWHGIDTPSVVIPVPVAELRPRGRARLETAGVIGSIDALKRTHLSVRRALERGFERVLVYGLVTDRAYYDAEIKPLRHDPRVRFMGHCDDRQVMYDSIDVVFHSSRSETFNLVKMECERAGVRYEGLASADTDAELWPAERILSAWKECLELR
jgi:glycosyltransferase involved in cell wall biosynthesis